MIRGIEQYNDDCGGVFIEKLDDGPGSSDRNFTPREYVLIPLDVLPEVVEESDSFAIIRPPSPDIDDGRVPTDPRGWVELVPKATVWGEREEMFIHDRVALFLAREAYSTREARKAEHEATLAVIRAATLPEELPPVDDVVSALRSLGYNVTAGAWNG